MLGEAARTEADAERYLAAYQHAIRAIGARRPVAASRQRRASRSSCRRCIRATRRSQRERVHGRALPRLRRWPCWRARADINLTIDAEEADRLELSLELLERARPRAGARRLARLRPRRAGLPEARPLRDRLAGRARRGAAASALMVRLVKGAYWDAEIKRAQVGGLPGYPGVHAQATPTSPTWPAPRAARPRADRSIRSSPPTTPHHPGGDPAMARRQRARLRVPAPARHGRGALRRGASSATSGVPCRVYAPVGSHETCCPTWCAGCWRTAPTPPSSTSSPTTGLPSRRCWPIRSSARALGRRPAAPRSRCRRDLYGPERAQLDGPRPRRRVAASPQLVGAPMR